MKKATQRVRCPKPCFVGDLNQTDYIYGEKAFLEKQMKKRAEVHPYYADVIVVIPHSTKKDALKNYVETNQDNPSAEIEIYYATCRKKGACVIHQRVANGTGKSSTITERLKERDEHGNPKFMAFLHVTAIKIIFVYLYDFNS
jgi:hypothetical protein